MTSTEKFQKAVIAQDLQLLANLLLHMPVFRVDFAEVPLIGVHVFQVEIRSADGFDTLHDFDDPTSCFRVSVAKKKGLLPFLQDKVPRSLDAIAQQVDFSGLRYRLQQDVAADPASAPRRCCKRRALFYDVADEEVLGNNEKICDRAR